MQPIKQLVKGEYQNYGARELLQQSVTVLIGANKETAEALKNLDIHSIFDLAASRIFNTAYEISKASEGQSSALSKHGLVASDSINNRLRGTSITDLAVQSIEALDGIGPNNIESLRQSIDLETIRDFSYWTPFQSARQILNSAFVENTEYEDPDAPSDLLPKSGEYATEKAYYSSIFIDEIISDDQESFMEINSSDFFPIDLSDEFEYQGFSKPATGAILTFEQAWYPEGLALGQLLHSVALAPGESTKIAIIDWERKLSTSTNEDISQSENLSNILEQNRTVGETVGANLKESQSGFSNTFGYGKAENKGGAGGASIPGLSFGFSSGQTENIANAMSVSSSKGQRQITGETLQKIDSSTQQNASSIRNRHAAVIKEVSQNESESIKTRTITNYNHSHALSVHYYEVVQIYRTITRLSKYDRCIFIPMRILDFGDTRIIHKYQNILLDSMQVNDRNLFESVQGFVNFKRAKSADLEYVKDSYNKNNYNLFSQKDWPQSIDSTLTSISAIRDNGIIDSIKIELLGQSKQSRKIIEYERQSGGFFLFEEPYKITEISRISYSLGSNELPNSSFSFILEFNFSKISSLKSLTTQIGFTVNRKQDQPLTSVPLLYAPENLNIQKLINKLNKDSLYYSQRVWNNLSSQEVAMFLSPYKINGDRLVEHIDTQPLTVHGNYLVLRYYSDDDDKWKIWKTKHVDENIFKQQTIPMATGGTFAEAVLGRFNASEKLDVTRFWNWQESPIPIQAPDIAPIQAGSRKEADNTAPGRLDAPIVNIMNPPSLPDPQGMSAVLNALSSSNMFRDMSGLAATASLAQQALKGSSEGATAASAQAGQNLKTVADLEKARLELVGKLLGGGLSNSGVSKIGALLNHGAKLDAKKIKNQKKTKIPNFEGSQPDNSNSLDSGEGDTGEDSTTFTSADSPTGSHEVDAFQGAIGSDFMLASSTTSTPSKSLSSGLLPNLSAWKELISFRPLHSVQNAVIIARCKIQTIEKALGDVNLDYYPVEVSKLPKNNGKSMTPEEFLSYIRLNINRFVDTNISEFKPIDSSAEILWTSKKPTDAVISIKMKLASISVDKGSVIVSRFSSDNWIFSTVYTAQDLYHPVSGNRQFGFIKEENNKYIFYTRGADRLSTRLDRLGGNTAFSAADSLWKSLQKEIFDYVNQNGGSAKILPEISKRYDWDRVKANYFNPTTPWLEDAIK
ncbi:MAG: hypothetical protein AAF215_18800 [Cyanobacteria bacterium P01_A01_bin.123]